MATEFSHSEDSDDIQKAIGLAVSGVIASGKPVNTENILAQLRESEKHSVDGTKKIYADAIRKLTQERE
ncbi:hypothetical protein ORN12_04840 [Pantoea vagans]|uniref:hypothetical protein n=1 Tax=Pantoea vagans TaxID=470934 RepID=UPI002254DFA2|nr:hypothetical protein [Pantoea vagans]MCX3308336.1 hypothetical protein [Pantoea vagans]